MTSARWRAVRADLTSMRGRSVLAIASLTVGTMAVGAMHLASGTVAASFSSSFLAANPPSTMLQTSPFGPELVDELLAHPAVGDLDARRHLEVRATGSTGSPRALELVAMPDFADNTVALIDPEEGRWPPADGQVVVERASLGELGVVVGDTVEVVHRDLAPVTLEVVGSAFDVYEIAPMLGGSPRAYVAMSTMTGLTGTTDLDSLYLRAPVDPLDQATATEMTATVRTEVLSPAGVSIAYAALQDPSEHLGEHTLSFIVTAMQLLSGLAIVIAVTLVLNTVTALLAQQRRQIGVMKALGATSPQLGVQYLGHVLALAVVALVLAVPVSIGGGRLLASGFAMMGNFSLVPLGIPWSTLALEAAIALVVPVLAVVVAVRRAVRTTVHEIIADRGLTESAGRSRGRRTRTRRPTVLAYRNAVRNRPRLALTVLTIGLCGGVLVGVLSTQAALARLSDQVAGYQDHDVQVALNEAAPSEEVVGIVAADADVTAVEAWRTAQAFRVRGDGTENGNINLVALPPDAQGITPTMLEGRWLAPDDDHAVVVNTHLVDEEPDIAVGDRIVLDAEGARGDWTVVGVSSTTLMGPGAHVLARDLDADTAAPGTTNLLAVQLASGADPDTVADRIDATLRDAGVDVGAVRTHATIRSDFESMVALGTALMLFVGGVLAVVAVVGVAGTMTLSVVDQTREIGVLRTLGATGRHVRRLLLVQGLAVAALGGLLGVLLSLPVARMLQGALSTGLIEADLPFGFSWLGVVVWIPVALLIGALGATRPARVASRLTIRDTLAYE